MIKNVKWFFVVLVFSSFISLSFSEEKVTLTEKQPAVGDVIPSLQFCNSTQSLNLQKSGNGYTLLSFWASYDAVSRENNASLAYFAEKIDRINLVSVSFDRYTSVFRAAVKKDHLPEDKCYVETGEEQSEIYRQFGLSNGFGNYLLDDKGVIIAQNVTINDLASFLK